MVDRADNTPAIFLTTQPPDRTQRRLAMVAVAITGAVFLIMAPFADIPLARSQAFLPIYQSALVVCDLITAALLFGRFHVVRSRAILWLASGYVFSAAMAVFHLLSFPGLFSASGLLGSGSQTTAWVYFAWHIGFPVAVIAYALSRDNVTAWSDDVNIGAARAIAMALALAIVAASAIMLVATVGHDALPAIMSGDRDLPLKYAVAWIAWLVTLAALPVLWRRKRRSVLDVWLMVVICAWLCDVAQSAVFNADRFSLGWYAGRAFGLLASSFLLVVLILEDSTLYRRLAQSFATERRQRRLVEAQTEELDALNRSLENRIRARTAEIESFNIELQRAREELKDMAILNATAREQERVRMARELHDEINQALVLLKLQIGRLEQYRSVGDADAAAKMSKHIDDVIDLTLVAAQRMAANLRPLILDSFGFTPAVQSLVEKFVDQHGVECELKIEPPTIDLQEPYSIAVFRILQEALANVARHAHASHVEIELAERDGTIELRVRDDGVGFDPSVHRKAASFGLVGLRERVHLVSGRLAVISAPGQGTTIEVSIPLVARSAHSMTATTSLLNADQR